MHIDISDTPLSGRITIRIAALLTVLAMLGSTSSRAQRADAEAAMSARGLALVDTTSKMINVRVQRLGEELQKLNAANPTAATSLTQERIAQNLQLIEDLLNYLDVARSLNQGIESMVNDSVAAMRSELPRDLKKKFLADLQDAVADERTAYDRYTDALVTHYKNMEEVLHFLAGINVQINNGQIQFTNKTDLNTYNEKTVALVQSNNRLEKTGRALQKALDAAQKKMEKDIWGRQ